MATIASTKYDSGRRTQLNDVFIVNSWALTDGDDGDPLEFTDYADRTVQVNGTFGGATVVIEGSLDGTNYHTLTDPVGNELSFTSADMATVMECVQYLRPRVSGGSGVSVSVYLLTRREVV